MNRNLRWTVALSSITAGALGFVSCSEDGGTATPTPTATGTPIVVVGAMTRADDGAVQVCDVKFKAAAGAQIKVGDDAQATEDNLRDGMVVRIQGTRHDDGVTGEFEAIETEPQIRGELHAKGADEFTVAGHHVLVDDSTVFEDRQSAASFSSVGFDDLAENEKVEVHGGLDDLGNIHASRVERRHDDVVDEVRGNVSALTATSFMLGTLLVSFSGATPITPSGASLAAGALVEVEGAMNAGGSFDASAIHIEDVEDKAFEPEHGQEIEVEGFVSDLTGHPGTLRVNEHEIETTGSTRFEHGTPDDFANNLRVTVEGHFDDNSSRISADAIIFHEMRVVLEGTPGSVSPLVVFGKTIVRSSTSEDSFSGSGRVRVRGREDASGNIVADRIENGGGGDRDIVQGEVAAEGASSLTVVGIDATMSAETEFKDINDAPISSAAFFAAVSARSAQGPGTLVKIKGAVSIGSSTTMTVKEAELER